METPASRMIRIDGSPIGLVGLDQALNWAAAQKLTEVQAEELLFNEIRRQNYIPSGHEEQYRAALRREHQRHLHGDRDRDESLVIRIFGPGCTACNGLQRLVIQTMDRLGLAADIEQIHDPDEIGRAGVLLTPALMIAGTIKSMGQHPTPVQVEQWLRSAVSHDLEQT